MATYQHYAQRREADGSTPPTIVVPEAATQTFVKGDLLTLSSGKAAIAVAANATHTSADLESGLVIGTAVADASGVTNTPVAIELITDNTLIRLPVIHGTPASAVTAVAQLGVGYDIGHWTDGSSVTGWGYMIDDTSVKNVIPVELIEPAGEVYGTAWCKIAQRARLDMVGA
jgi:hypothetical protein